jgi:hypothetical protein
MSYIETPVVPFQENDPAAEAAAQAVAAKAEVNPSTDTPLEAAPTKEDPFHKQYAAFVKKEQKMMSEIRELKAEAARAKQLLELKGKAKDSPMDWIKEGGLTMDDFLKAADKVPEPPTVEDRIGQLEKLLEAEKQSKTQEAETKAVTAFKSQISDHVKANLDKFELISSMESVDTVFDTIELYWQKTREQLPIEKACELVEQQLTEELTASKSKLEKTKKFQSIFSPKLETPTPQTQGQDITLTNKLTSPGGAAQRPSSREESLKRAASLLKWT